MNFKEVMKMYRVIFKDRFKSKPINLGRAVRVMYGQPFTGSIRIEHITWWKRYLIRFIYLEVIYPKKGWIQLVKIFREGKPSVRVITKAMPNSSKRELVILNKLYGEEVHNVEKIEKRRNQFRRSQKHSEELNSSSSLERSNTNSNG